MRAMRVRAMRMRAMRMRATTVRFYGYCCESVAARQHPHYETPGAEQSADELVIRVID